MTPWTLTRLLPSRWRCNDAGEAGRWLVGVADALRPGLTDLVNVLVYAHAYCTVHPDAVQLAVTLSPNA